MKLTQEDKDYLLVCVVSLLAGMVTLYFIGK
jgi:hypothetical protein